MKQVSRLEMIGTYEGKIDFHGFTVEEAKKELQNILNKVSSIVWEIRVIHGFHGGTAIKDMVWKVKHPRIKRVRESFLNRGETILELNHK